MYHGSQIVSISLTPLLTTRLALVRNASKIYTSKNKSETYCTICFRLTIIICKYFHVPRITVKSRRAREGEGCKRLLYVRRRLPFGNQPDTRSAPPIAIYYNKMMSAKKIKTPQSVDRFLSWGNVEKYCGVVF